MDYFLLILGIICITLGFIGCLIPVIPGPPISYVGLLFLHFTRFADFEISILLWLGLITIIVQVLDFVMPVWGAKKFGGSKYGAWGSGIGLIIGLFFIPAIGPFSIVTILGGPFLGAYIGEKLGGKNSDIALKAAFGSFIGFLAGTFIKLMAAVAITWYFIAELINYFKN